MPKVLLRRRACIFLSLLLGFLLAAPVTAQEGDSTLVGVAEETPDFSTLLSALETAELTETLQGTGPYTLFAPTNEAFAKLSESDLSALLADREALRHVLSHHIVPGSYTTSDITEQMRDTGFTTLLGDTLTITEEGVGNASVTTVNIPASNGVIFAIDTVLTPAEPAPVTAPPETLDETRARYSLSEVGGSGVSGSALLAEYANERTIVTLSLSGTPAGGEHPALLYEGSCAALPATPLAPLEAYRSDLGFSTTPVAIPYGVLVSGTHALAVQASATDATVVACGEIGRAEP